MSSRNIACLRVFWNFFLFVMLSRCPSSVNLEKYLTLSLAGLKNIVFPHLSGSFWDSFSRVFIVVVVISWTIAWKSDIAW